MTVQGKGKEGWCCGQERSQDLKHAGQSPKAPTYTTGQGHIPTAPTARAGTNMPVDAPTPLVHIMRVKEKKKRQVRAPKSKRKSVPSGRGSPRWMIRRRL